MVQVRGLLRRDSVYSERTSTSAASQILSPFSESEVTSAFFCPIPQYATNTKTKPLLMYVPGIDGTGYAAAKQFKRVSQSFDIVCLRVPSVSRESFDELVEKCREMIAYQLEMRKSDDACVVVLGESFGALIALALTSRAPELVDRVVVVNSATAFRSSMWASGIGMALASAGKANRDAWNAVPILMAPILGDPIRLVGLDPMRPLESAERALNLLPRLASLSTVLPPEVLEWKLKLLTDGCNALPPERLRRIWQRALIVASGNDRLLPSEEEGKRLNSLLARSTLVPLPEASHAALQEEGGTDLLNTLTRAGFDLPPRWSSQRRRSGKAHVAVEFPTASELDAGRRGATNVVKTLCSPVFLSTRETDGAIIAGLDGVPNDGRPMLLVGNHQTFAADTGVFIDALLSEGRMVRGLAHPAVMRAGGGGAAVGAAARAGGGSGIANFMTRFGAVEVTGRNLYRLLAAGETALLFPGGVREAYKRRNEEYKTFWPSTVEFVRMAAKLRATIVPFGAIGVDDSVDLLLDANDILGMPILGERARAAAARMPQPARRDADDYEHLFVQPVSVPRSLTPPRLYFMFGRPIRLDDEDIRRPILEDETAALKLYEDVHADVDRRLEYLLREGRPSDPYRDFGRRVVYETISGKRAPSFL